MAVESDKAGSRKKDGKEFYKGYEIGSRSAEVLGDGVIGTGLLVSRFRRLQVGG